jgi:hypothetical protein
MPQFVKFADANRGLEIREMGAELFTEGIRLRRGFRLRHDFVRLRMATARQSATGRRDRGDVEAAERAVGVGRGRLVLFTAHEIAGGIHGPILAGGWDKGCLSQKYLAGEPVEYIEIKN